jgi:hypothetical protein
MAGQRCHPPISQPGWAAGHCCSRYESCFKSCVLTSWLAGWLQLWLAAGNNAGVVGLFPVVEPPPALGRSEEAPPAAAGSVFAAPQAVLARGHDEVRRAGAAASAFLPAHASPALLLPAQHSTARCWNRSCTACPAAAKLLPGCYSNALAGTGSDVWNGK